MKYFIRHLGTRKSHKLPQIIAILISSSPAISYGILTTWTSPAIPELLADTKMEISFEQASYFTVISSICMAISGPCASYFIDVIGRKKLLFAAAVPHLISWIFVYFASNVWLFYIARCFAGMGDAVTFVVISVYASETSEARVRDFWGNATSINAFLGTFVINLIGAYYRIKTTAIIFGGLSLLQIILFCFIPESPYYLLMKNRNGEAKTSLRCLRWREDVENELLAISLAVQRQIAEAKGLKELFFVKNNQKALGIALIAKFVLFFSGIPAYMAYTQYLFKESGGDISEKTSSIIFSAALFATAIPGSYITGKFGKRPLMLFSSTACGIILAILAGYLSIKQFTSINLNSLNWFPITCMLVFIVCCNVGVSNISSAIVGELFSASIKSKALGFMTIAHAAFQLIVPKLFQWTTYRFGIFAPFIIFATCCFISAILSHFYMIETKGKTLEDIQIELKGFQKQNIEPGLNIEI